MFINSLKKYFFLLLVFFSASKTTAQSEDYSVKHYTVAEGLPINNVRSINKDKNGFYWILTSIGLARFDGERIESFSYAINSKERIPFIDYVRITKKNVIYYYCNDTTIYFVDENSHLCKLDYKKTFGFNRTLGNELVLKYTFKDLSSIDYRLFNEFKEMNNQNKIFYCNQDTDSTFYLFCSNGFFYITKKKVFKLFNFNSSNTSCFSIKDKFIVTINDNYYVYRNGVLLKKDTNNFIKTNYPLNKEIMFGFIERNNRCFLTLNNSVYEIKISDENELIFYNLFSENKQNFQNYFYDSDNNCLFLGTHNEGFFVYRKKMFFNRKKPEKNKYHNNVYSILIENENNIITNVDCLNAIYNNKKHGYEFVGPVCNLNNGSFLMSTFFDLFLFDKKLKSYTKINKHTNGFKQIILTDSIAYILANTLSYYNIASKKLTENQLRDFPNNGTIINAITKCSKKNFFFIAKDRNLELVDFEKKQIKILTKNLPYNVRSLDFDSANSILFITTKGNGIFIYTESKGITELPIDEKQSLYYSHYVLQDRSGDYWIPTNTGLILLRQKELLNFLNHSKSINYTRYGINEGIINEEFNGGFSGAGIVYGDSLALASMAGVVVFNANIKNKELVENGVLVIDEVKVNGNKIKFDSSITLEPNYKQFLIKVSYPSVNRKYLEIQYRIINGNDTSWSFVNGNGLIEIKNIKPGKYILEIRVEKNNSQYKKILLFIQPYWYNTWWAYSIWFILFFVGSYIIFMWRWQTLKNKNLELQKLSRDKLFTTIAHDLASPIKNFTNLSDNVRFLIEQKDFETIDLIGKELDQKSKNLNLLLSNILHWSNFQQNNANLSTSIFLIQDLLDEITPAFNDIAMYNNTSISINNLVRENINASKTILSIIIRNLLDNAVKNSAKNSTIFININLTNRVLRFEISNTCSNNIKPETLHYINQVFQNKIKPEPNNQHIGLGIAVISECLSKIKGIGSVYFYKEKFNCCIDILI